MSACRASASRPSRIREHRPPPGSRLERHGRLGVRCPLRCRRRLRQHSRRALRGQAAIAAGHAAIFQTIYAGSTNRYTVEGARLLRPEVALVRVYSMLDAPHGPLAGRHAARFSLVLTKEEGGWEIAAFHNTLEAAPGPPR